MKKSAIIMAMILSAVLLASCVSPAGQQSTETAPQTEAPQQAETVLPEETEAPAEPESGELSPLGTDPELRAFLDSYEEFIDSYVLFLQEYSASDDTMGMMGEYLQMVQQLTEMEEKLEAWDTEKMSDADILYYEQVMLRCSQKLLGAVN